MSAFPAVLAALFAAAMVISAIGFYKYVYFISLGYGFSIAGLGLLMLYLFRSPLPQFYESHRKGHSSATRLRYNHTWDLLL